MAHVRLDKEEAWELCDSLATAQAALVRVGEANAAERLARCLAGLEYRLAGGDGSRGSGPQAGDPLP